MIKNGKEIIAEVLCVLSWSGKAQKAFNDALADYHKHGSPAIPMGHRNYQKAFKADKKPNPKERIFIRG